MELLVDRLLDVVRAVKDCTVEAVSVSSTFTWRSRRVDMAPTSIRALGRIR